MCYHCLKKYLLITTDAVMEEIGSGPEASVELKSKWDNLISVMKSSAMWSSESKGEGRTDPLTFSFAVVVEHMKNESKSSSEPPITPQRMHQFLKQAFTRMSTITNVNPHGKAKIGVEVMPAVLHELGAKLSSAAADQPTRGCHK